MKSNARLFAVLTLLNFIWAPVNLTVRYAQAAGFSAVGIGLVRWIGIALLLAILVRIPALAARFNLKKPTRRDAALSVLLGLLLTGPAHLFYYLALQHTQTVEGTVFNTTSPLWVALFAGLLLRERIDGRRWIALALGMAGAYVTAIGFALPSLTAGHASWNALYMAGTIMESITGVLLAGLVRRSSGLTVLGAEAFGMAGAMLVAALVAPGALAFHVPAVSLSWWPLAYLVLCAGVFAFGTWATLVERAPISLMVVSTAIQPPVAAVIGYFALGEKVTMDVGIGGVLVVAALVVAVGERSGLGVLSGPGSLSPGHEVAGD